MYEIWRGIGPPIPQFEVRREVKSLHVRLAGKIGQERGHHKTKGYFLSLKVLKYVPWFRRRAEDQCPPRECHEGQMTQMGGIVVYRGHNKIHFFGSSFLSPGPIVGLAKVIIMGSGHEFRQSCRSTRGGKVKDIIGGGTELAQMFIGPGS